MSDQQHKTTQNVSDVRIVGYEELPLPSKVIGELANPNQDLVSQTRSQIHDILENKDDRLLVVVGPCSIHDPKAAYEYAEKLKIYADKVSQELLIVMRVYFEKPRTTVGWKGLINDPNLDNSYDIHRGLLLAREILVKIGDIGLPTGSEFLDTFIPQYISDTVAWGAIGARTTESQVHRELASGLSCPVGFKNGTAGNITIAIDAVQAARCPHHFPAITPDGLCAIAQTKGNLDTHIILRGGSTGTNYDATSIADTSSKLEKAGLPQKIMVDFSHANSSKQFKRQLDVGEDIATQIASGEKRIFGVMAESNLNEGRQNLFSGETLEYGVSITDGCLGWQDTEILLDNLATAVQQRRK